MKKSHHLIIRIAILAVVTSQHCVSGVERLDKPRYQLKTSNGDPVKTRFVQSPGGRLYKSDGGGLDASRHLNRAQVPRLERGDTVNGLISDTGEEYLHCNNYGGIMNGFFSDLQTRLPDSVWGKGMKNTIQNFNSTGRGIIQENEITPLIDISDDQEAHLIDHSNTDDPDLKRALEASMASYKREEKERAIENSRENCTPDGHERSQENTNRLTKEDLIKLLQEKEEKISELENIVEKHQKLVAIKHEIIAKKEKEIGEREKEISQWQIMAQIKHNEGDSKNEQLEEKEKKLQEKEEEISELNLKLEKSKESQKIMFERMQLEKKMSDTTHGWYSQQFSKRKFPEYDDSGDNINEKKLEGKDRELERKYKELQLKDKKISELNAKISELNAKNETNEQMLGILHAQARDLLKEESNKISELNAKNKTNEQMLGMLHAQARDLLKEESNKISELSLQLKKTMNSKPELERFERFERFANNVYQQTREQFENSEYQKSMERINRVLKRQ